MLRMRIFSRKCGTKFPKNISYFFFFISQDFLVWKIKELEFPKNVPYFYTLSRLYLFCSFIDIFFCTFSYFFCTWKIDDVCAFPHFPWIVETKALYYGLVKWFYGFLGVEIVFDLYNGFLKIDCKLCSHGAAIACRLWLKFSPSKNDQKSWFYNYLI